MARINQEIARLELIKEHFNTISDCQIRKDAQVLMAEGINRVIKGIKWQAYGYKDMLCFTRKSSKR